MTPIKIKLLVDLEGIEFEEVDGYLVDDKNAFMITEHDEIWVLPVILSDNGYIQKNTYIEIGLLPEGADKMTILKRLYDQLCNMSGWEFVTDILMNLEEEVTLRLVE